MSRGPKYHRPGMLVKLRETGEPGHVYNFRLHPTDRQHTGDWVFDFHPLDGGEVTIRRTLELTKVVSPLQVLADQADECDTSSS